MEKKHQTLKELPVSERPYEKCEKSGPEVLSDAELLAVILRSGSLTEVEPGRFTACHHWKEAMEV